MNSPAHPVDHAFAALHALIERDPGLQAEFARAAREFGGASGGSEKAADLWLRRLVEWFVLERAAGSLRAPPLEELLDAARERDDGALIEHAALLRGSQVGVFTVTGVEPGRGLWMKELASRGEYPIAEGEAAALFQVGDVVAGRIFPLADGSWHVSRAAAFHRNEELLRAVESDLERARATRRGFVRVSQLELERMFFAPAPEGEQDAVGAARDFLTRGGVAGEEIEQLFERLAEAPFDPERVVHGADDVLAEVLDRLAFDTAVDLDEARRLLVLAWSEIAGLGRGRGAVLQPAERPTGRVRRDVPEAIAEFDRARARGAPLEDALRELESDLELDVDADGEPEGPAPDFPGVVGAVVEEYLWELRAKGDARAEESESLRAFADYGKAIGVLENLGQRDLLAYACHWLPENAVVGDADSARAHLAAWNEFLRWMDVEHGLALHAAFKPTLRGLESSLPRVVEANRRRTRTSDLTEGELLELLSSSAATRLRLRDRAGDEFEAEIDPELAQWLRPGDCMRARLHPDGRLAVYCCYPPEARGLTDR